MITTKSNDPIDKWEHILLQYLGEGTVTVRYSPNFLGYNLRWRRKNRVVETNISDMMLVRSLDSIDILKEVAKKFKVEIEKVPEDLERWAMDRLLGKI